MGSRITLAALAAALLLAFALPSQAAHFDVVYVAEYDLTLCTNGCGITLAGGNDFMLLVNKGGADIGAAELSGAQFTTNSSVPDLQVIAFLNDSDPPLAPILPNEAVGGVGPLGDVLTPLLLAGETFRDTAPRQVFALEIYRSGAYNGPVTVTVTVKVGNEVATLALHFNFQTGPHDIAFRSGARASSTVPTAARPTSWGRLKAMYR